MIVKRMSSQKIWETVRYWEPFMSMMCDSNTLKGIYVVPQKTIIISNDFNLFWQLDTFIHELNHHLICRLALPYCVDLWVDKIYRFGRYVIGYKIKKPH